MDMQPLENLSNTATDGTPGSRAVRDCDREERSSQEQRVDENEGIASNPAGRTRLNVINFNGHGAPLKLGTWNVRTLHRAGKLDNCIMEMKDHGVDLMGLAEVRWTESGKVEKEGHHLYYSGGEKHEYGVGVLVNKKHVRTVY